MLSPAKNGSKPETAQLSIKCMESIYFAILIQGNLYSHEKANFLLHTIIWVATTDMGFLDSSADKESTCNAGALGSIPGLERSPGEGKGYPLQYSGLENSMD